MPKRDLQIPDDPSIDDRLAKEIADAERELDIIKKTLEPAERRAKTEIGAHEALQRRLKGIKKPALFIERELATSNDRISKAISERQRFEQDLKRALGTLDQLLLAKKQLGQRPQ